MSNVFQGGSPQSTPEITSGMVLQLANTTIAACNPRAAEILGYTTEQLIGATTFAPPWQTIYEDGSPFPLEAHPAIVALRSQQSVTDIVMGFYRPDGELVWLKLDSQPLFQANATAPYAVVSTIWDITAQKRQESLVTVRSFLETEALPQLIELETIYTTAPIGLCFVDTDLRFVRLNQHLADINGLPISEHIGRSLQDVLPQQADELEPLYRQAIASGEPLLNLEIHGINRAQPEVERDWIVNLHPLKQADGRVLGVNVTVQDVTERKRLERDLREADRQIATIWDNMTDAYLSLDREWRITYVNQAAIRLFYQLTNLEPEAFLGKTQWEIFPWTVGQVVEQQYRRAMTEQVPVHFEVLYEPTGNWFETHVYPSAAGLGIYFREISDRKQAEIDLRESEHRYRTLFETIDEGFCVCEMLFDEHGKPIDYRFLEINPAFEQMTGLKQAAGRTARELVPNLEASWFEIYGKVVLTGEPVRFEDRSEAMNRWFDVNAFRINEPQSHKFALLFTNISDRKQVQIALQQSEERLSLAIDTAGMATWDADMQTGKVIWSNSHFDLLGYEPVASGEAIVEMWRSRIHADDVEAVMQALEQAQQTRSLYCPEYRIIRADTGEIRWLKAFGRFLHDERQAVRFIGVLFDDSERKIAEAALQESRERLQLALWGAGQGSWDWDLRTEVLTWDDRCKEIFGLPPNFPVTYEWHIEALHPDDRQRVSNATAIALRDRTEFNEEYRTFYPNGTMRWILARGRGYYDAQGEPYRMSGTVMDISDRIQAEQSLQQRHARLNLLYETTNGLLSAEQPLTFISSLFGKLSAQLNLQYYFTFMVEERDRCQMLHLKSYAGISQAAAEAIEWLEFGQGICGVVAQEHRQILVNNVQQSTLPNAQIIRSLGITAYVSQPLIVQGRLLGTLSFASSTRTSFTSEEIALMQAATDQIAVAIERANLIDSLQQQTEQLIQTNRLKDEFLAVLSHELRSPLNPILGWVKLLQTRKFNETKTAEALATIERNAQLQAQLIEDLLDISRIMRGKIALNAAPVNLASVVSSALDTVQLAAEAKAIQLQVTLASSGLQVFGDATRLQQVVWNLLSNAIKFTPHGGQVEISLEEGQPDKGTTRQGEKRADPSEGADPAEGELQSNIQHPKSKIQNFPTTHYSLLTTHSPGYAQIQVIDTGKGIDPEFLPYVFEYFRQEDGSTTRKFGGLGLGLAIAKQIVEMHGGTIGVDSLGEGHGATFTVMLPLLEEKRADPAGGEFTIHNFSFTINSPHPAPLQGVRILLVDDDADTSEFLSVVLEQKGAIVSNASSAAEALQILDRSSFDILLSDIGMPETDGYELIRTIRLSASARSIPAIALTAYAQDADRQQAIAAGFQHHVAKPFDTDAVVALIVELVSRKGSSE